MCPTLHGRKSRDRMCFRYIVIRNQQYQNEPRFFLYSAIIPAASPLGAGSDLKQFPALYLEERLPSQVFSQMGGYFSLVFSLTILHHTLLIRIKSHAHCSTIHCPEIITPPSLKLWKSQISEGYDSKVGRVDYGYLKLCQKVIK